MSHPSPSHPDAKSPVPDTDPEKGLVPEDEQSQDHTFQEGRQHGLQRWLNDPRVRRPVIIAMGPLPIFCFIFIVFAITFRRSVAFPDPFAPYVGAHIQSATMIIAVIATIIASCTSFLFSCAVRYVIAIRLSIGPTSLETLSSANRIAQRGLWLNDPRVKWTWIVGIAFVAVSLQTSALTSLLNVREIRDRQKVAGGDLDLSNPQLLQSARNLANFQQTYSQLTSFFMQNAMISALQVKRDAPSSFNFNGYTYLSTTGGIQPASFVQTQNEHLTNHANLPVPPNLQVDGNDHTSLPFNKTMRLTQQGFTADVDCRIKNPQDLAMYTPTFTPTVNLGNLSLVGLQVTCPGNRTATTPPVLFDASQSKTIGAVLAAICPIPNTNNYDLIIRATEPYNLLDGTVCTIAPKLTTVNVIYYNSPKNLRVPTTIDVSEPISKVDVPIWGNFAAGMLWLDIILGQSTIGSTIGNAWLLTPGAQANIPLPEVMNTYIKAAIEFSGTVMRQLFTQPDSLFIPGGWSNVSESMRMPIRGTFTATTYGWRQDRTVSPLFLLPTAITILTTYALLAYGVRLAMKHKEKIHKEDADFDPTDIVHVVAAHTPETRKNEFKTFSDAAATYRKRTSVRINSQHGVRSLEVTRGKTPQEGESKGEPIGLQQSAVRDSDTEFEQQELNQTPGNRE